MPMLLADLVRTSAFVATSRARSAKIAALADLLARVEPAELEPAVAFLAGEPRQGKVGVGWATLVAVDAAAAEVESLTVTDLDAALTSLQALTGPGSATARQAWLAELLARATAAEADFVRRLLLGELRQGALDGVVTDAVARAAGIPAETVRRAAMLAGDLGRVARLALGEGEAGLARVTLEVLRPVRPMLASSAVDVGEALRALGPSAVEWKLDGARVQAHRSGPDVRLFTRNLNDITDRLPGVVGLVRSLAAERIVLDGEVVGVGDGERPGPFQDTMSRFTRRAGAGAGLGVWFFDCLHMEGRDLIDDPLVDRLAALDRVAGPWRVPSVVTDDEGEAVELLEAALRAGHEGVMVKAAASRYEAGRRGQAWRKVKPVRTLDLVVLAAEWGHGRRRGWLSNLHLGARGAEGFVMVGKTFKGLTDEMLSWQTEQLLTLEVTRRGIVVEVRPELVVEVALDGVQSSTRYPGDVALRFARVRRYRPDKSPAEADTIESVRGLAR